MGSDVFVSITEWKADVLESYHLPLFFTVDEVIVVLHADRMLADLQHSSETLGNVPDKLVPPILLSNVLQRLELPCRHRTRTNVPDPTLLDNIVQRLHNLLPWCTTIKTVDLQDIDVCTKALDALLNSVEDVLAAEADLVDHLAVVDGHRCDTERWVFFVDTEVAFRKEDELVAGDVVLLDGFGDDLLGDAMGVGVGLKQLLVPTFRHVSP